jgi:hypothetical protein
MRKVFIENLPRGGVDVNGKRISTQRINWKDCVGKKLKFIYNSELSNILDLAYVNWDDCDKYATRNLVKTVCDFYNKNQIVPAKLCHMFGISEGTIVKYLKKGEELGWCNYNSKKHYLRCVVCINTKTVFESLISASNWYGLNTSTCVKRVCEGKGKTAGEHPKTGERLSWMYFEEYIYQYGEADLIYYNHKEEKEIP